MMFLVRFEIHTFQAFKNEDWLSSRCLVIVFVQILELLYEKYT